MSEEPQGGQPRSGLRNPAASVRGVGAAGLVTEALVLLLAIIPLNVLGGGHGGGATAAVVGLAVVCLVLCGLLRHAWAWYVGSAVPFVLLALGVLIHPSLAVLGVLFGLMWLYILHVRRRVLR